MRKNELKTSFPATAGIALADILANGVAVILLLIVVNLSVKQEKVHDLIETIEEVSLLLSRDFAKKVIHNALPTSVPAQLHDYEGSHIDRFPVFARMPVFEIHKEGVRDYFSNTFWSKNELLQRDNSLDQFLLSLNEEQLRRIRVDVYSIESFYLFISILKDHAITVRHWHFYGEDQLPKGMDSIEHNLQDNAVTKGKEAQMKLNGLSRLPQGAELREWSAVAERLETTLEANPKDHADTEGSPSLKPDSTSQMATIQTHTQKLKLSIAKEMQEAKHNNNDAMPVNDFQNVIAFIFHLLITGNEKVAQGQFDYLTTISLMDEMIHYIYRFPKLSPYRGFMVEKVANLMRIPESSALLGDEILIEKDEGKKAAVVVPVNQPIKKIGIVSDQKIETNSYPVSFSLRLYPAAFEGVHLPLTSRSLLLLPLENQSQALYQWQLVAVMDRVTLNTTVGFVYGQVIDGKLHIVSNENELNVGGHILTRNLSVDESRHQRRLLWFYLLISFLGLVLLVRWRK